MIVSSTVPDRPEGWSGVTHRYLASLTVLAIVVQFFLAGAGAFHATGYAPHRALGSLGADTQAWFGAIHAVNALAVMAAAGTLARRTWLAARS